jgi:hypothetical protein
MEGVRKNIEKLVVHSRQLLFLKLGDWVGVDQKLLTTKTACYGMLLGPQTWMVSLEWPDK